MTSENRIAVIAVAIALPDDIVTEEEALEYCYEELEAAGLEIYEHRLLH